MEALGWICQLLLNTREIEIFERGIYIYKNRLIKVLFLCTFSLGVLLSGKTSASVQIPEKTVETAKRNRNSKYGDVNNDGVIDSMDLALLKGYLIGRLAHCKVGKLQMLMVTVPLMHWTMLY